MLARVREEIIATLLLMIMLIIGLVFLFSNEKEAVEIDLGDIEGWQSEHLPAQPEIIGKE
jgi:hypothetical protein